MTSVESGLATLSAAASDLARLQARDHEALSNFREVASPAKIQEITNALASIERNPASKDAMALAISSSKEADESAAKQIDANTAGLMSVSTDVTSLKSQTKIIFPVLGALGLAALSALGAWISGHAG